MPGSSPGMTQGGLRGLRKRAAPPGKPGMKKPPARAPAAFSVRAPGAAQEAGGQIPVTTLGPTSVVEKDGSVIEAGMPGTTPARMKV